MHNRLRSHIAFSYCIYMNNIQTKLVSIYLDSSVSVEAYCSGVLDVSYISLKP